MSNRRIPDEDLGPAWLRDEVSINVQVDGLRDFSKALLEDLEKNFGTHLPQVYDAMSVHACVGDGLFFPEMNAVRNRHHEALQATANQLRDHARGTFAMATGATIVADKYGDADALAKAKAQDVEHVMNPPNTKASAHTTSADTAPVTTTGTGTSVPQIVDKGTS